MPLVILLKILIIGALFGAVLMFISAFTRSKGESDARLNPGPNKLMVIVRFILKLIVFILIIIFPFFLLRLIA